MAILDFFNPKSNNSVSQVTFPFGNHFRGDLRVNGDCHLSGDFEGNVFSEGLVYIDSTANFTGFISAHHIIISGNFQGQLDCKILEILDKGTLRGDIRAVDLNVETGANFFGHSHHEKEQTFRNCVPKEVTEKLMDLDKVLIEDKQD